MKTQVHGCNTQALARHTRQPGFTLTELLVTVLIIVVLASIMFGGMNYLREQTKVSRSISGMRQLAAATILYAQGHNGNIPRGDEGADGAGVGGRGIIWINHIAEDCGYPELTEQTLNQSRDGMDQWTYLLTRYKEAPFVCAALSPNELAICKKTTPDAIGGIGYNVQPLKAKTGGNNANNASWGSKSAPIALSHITHTGSRCMYASSYDWHLITPDRRAYNRFGKDRATMVFWDGSARLVTRREFDRSIDQPDVPFGIR